MMKIAASAAALIAFTTLPSNAAPVSSNAATLEPKNVARCNRRAADSTEFADLPGLLAETSASLDDSPLAEPLNLAPPAGLAEDRRQDWSIDLGKELKSLLPLSGLGFEQSPILLLRLENLPRFDTKRNCNRVFPILGKPRIERLGDGSVRATLDKYSYTLEAGKTPKAWNHDPNDTTGRIYWIVPARFGRTSRGPWELTAAYEQAFRRAPAGSVRRSWLAETYLDLAMRTYWDQELSRAFPRGEMPPRDDLDKKVIAKTSIDCSAKPSDLFCLSAQLIELNENGILKRTLSRDAFRTSDAIYESSGLTVGIQQLDLAVDPEARKRLPKWMPTTVGDLPPSSGPG